MISKWRKKQARKRTMINNFKRYGAGSRTYYNLSKKGKGVRKR